MEVIHQQLQTRKNTDSEFAAFVIFCAPAPAAPPFSAAGHCHAPGHALTSNLNSALGSKCEKTRVEHMSAGLTLITDVTESGSQGRSDCLRWAVGGSQPQGSVS